MTHPDRRRRPRGPVRGRRALLALPAVAAFVALVIVDCGGVAAAANGPASQTGNSAIKLVASNPLATCLKKHGVSLPKNFKTAKGSKPPKGFKPTAKNFKPTAKNFKPPKGFKPSKNFKPTKESKKLEKALKACGGGSGGFLFGGSPSSKGGAAASAVKAYLSCLSTHGVKVPKKDRKGGTLTGLSSQPKFATANRTCSVLLPTSTTTTSGT